MPITVGPFCLTHPVNFPCGRKPEYPEETHDFRQSVDFLLFSHEDWVRVALRKFSLRLEPAASEVKGKCANHLNSQLYEGGPSFLQDCDFKLINLMDFTNQQPITIQSIA